MYSIVNTRTGEFTPPDAHLTPHEIKVATGFTVTPDAAPVAVGDYMVVRAVVVTEQPAAHQKIATGSWEWDAEAREVRRYDTPVDMPIAAVLDRRLAELAVKRWEVETSGLTLPDGTTIATDDRAKTLLGNARMMADAGEPTDTRQIKAASGWVSLTNTEILALWQAVATHVQACFDAEKAHDDALRTLTDATDVASYDISTGWPGA